MSTSWAADWTAADDYGDWRDDAACGNADPELFFPDDDTKYGRARMKTAKLICRACPVRGACLSWALHSGYEAGIWGGYTEEERRAMRRSGRFPVGQGIVRREYEQYTE